jgi:hypothetical protein
MRLVWGEEVPGLGSVCDSVCQVASQAGRRCTGFSRNFDPPPPPALSGLPKNVLTVRGS